MTRHLGPDDIDTCTMCERQWVPADHPSIERYGLCPWCADESLRTCMVCEEFVDPSSAAGRVGRPLCDADTFDDKIVVHVGGDRWVCIEPFPVDVRTVAGFMERRGVATYPTVDMLLAHDITAAAA